MLLLRLLPGGRSLGQTIAFAWALQWVVADALEDARTLAPGETLLMQDAQDRLATRPWFVRFFYAVGSALPGALGSPLRAFARLVDKLAITSRDEFAVMERHPALTVGFALTTGALLAVPVLNLFFRPIILVASAQLLGNLERVAPEHGAVVDAPIASASASAPLPEAVNR